MSIKRINEFPEGSGNLTNDDIFVFMDDPAGSGITKKISLSQIADAIGGGGGGGNPFDQDLNTFNSPTFSGVTVSGSQIIGGGTGSGDGNGYGTIELVPDSGLYSNDQYLIVDPTAPSHIHLRAGGTQDASNAELIVGGEKNHLRVNDFSPTVRMQTETFTTLDTYYLNSSEFSSAVWETVDGNHRVVINDPSPTVYSAVWALNSDSLFNVIDDGSNYYELTNTGSSTPGGSSPVIVYVNQAPPVSPTTLTQLTFEIRENRQTYLEANGSDVRIQAADDVRIYSNDLFRLYNYSPNDPIEIFTDYDDQEYRWQFTPSAEFISPNGATIGTNGEGALAFYNTGNSNAVAIVNRNIDSGANLALVAVMPSASGGLATITVATTGVDSYEYWDFKDNGILNLASNGIQFSDGTIQNTAGVSIEAVQDNLGTSFFVAGEGVSLTYNDDPGNTLTVSTSSAPKIVTNVFNKTGSPIPKFSVVYINGGQGDQPTIALAQANTESTSTKTYGITAETIAHMSAGTVIVVGALTGVNTDQFNPTAPTGDVNGTTLWLSPTTPGGVTTTKPSAPNHAVAVGTIVRTHQNQGVIEVRIQNGYELEELHNVAITGVTNGQFLQYNSSTQLWVPSSSGNFTSLQVSGTSVSLSGHTHTASNITDFNTSVSGLLPTVANSGDNRILTSTGTTTGINAESNLTFDGSLLTITGGLVANSGNFDQIYPTVVSNGNVGGNVNTNVSAGQIFDMILTGSTTLSNPTNPVDGVTIRWRITQDGTGGHAVTLDTKFQIPSSASSPLPWSTAANAMDVLAATYHAGRDKWDIVAFVPGY